jgi:hypothetical protein
MYILVGMFFYSFLGGNFRGLEGVGGGVSLDKR